MYARLIRIRATRFLRYTLIWISKGLRMSMTLANPRVWSSLMQLPWIGIATRCWLFIVTTKKKMSHAQHFNTLCTTSFYRALVSMALVWSTWLVVCLALPLLSCVSWSMLVRCRIYLLVSRLVVSVFVMMMNRYSLVSSGTLMRPVEIFVTQYRRYRTRNLRELCHNYWAWLLIVAADMRRLRITLRVTWTQMRR